MKTSFWTSIISPIAVPFKILAMLTLLALLGCSGEEGVDDQSCVDTTEPGSAQHPATILHRSKINITQEETIDATGGSTTESTIQASFTDITKVVTTSRATDLNVGIGGMPCVGLTGAPYTSCRKGYSPPCIIDPLDVEKVIVDGVGTGAVTLNRTSAGKFSAIGITGKILGATDAKVTISSKNDAKYYPAYSQTLTPTTPVELLTPDLQKAVGSLDLRVSWKPGNGDYMLIQIGSTKTGITDKVICRVKDDGCFTVYQDALDWLEIKTGDTFKFSVTRYSSTAKSPDSTTSALLASTTKLSAVMTR